MLKENENNINQKYFNIHQLAQYTGTKESTIRAYIFQREIPYIKINKMIRFNISDIDQWLKEKSISCPTISRGK